MEGITWALRLVLPTTDRGRGIEVSSSAPEDVTSASKAKDMGDMQKSCATSFIKDRFRVAFDSAHPEALHRS